MQGIYNIFETQVCRKQVSHLHGAAHASPSFKFYPSVLLMIETGQPACEKLNSYCKNLNGFQLYSCQFIRISLPISRTDSGVEEVEALEKGSVQRKCSNWNLLNYGTKNLKLSKDEARKL